MSPRVSEKHAMASAAERWRMAERVLWLLAAVFLLEACCASEQSWTLFAGIACQQLAIGARMLEELRRPPPPWSPA